MRILFIGDIFGSPGRRAVAQLVPRLIAEKKIDVVIANAENAAGGNGLTIDTAEELLNSGPVVLTGGNHTWRHKEIVGLLKRRDDCIVRPYNFPQGTPGRGWTVCETADGHTVGVLNLQGRVFMDPLPSPFTAVDEVLDAIHQKASVVIVDFHAEATSEKRALGWYVDGRVTALFGTHTHVQTADEEILPQGTAYLTDVGMTGPYDSVIGMKKDNVLERFLTMRPTAFAAAKADVRLCGVIVQADPQTGKALSIERVCEKLKS